MNDVLYTFSGRSSEKTTHHHLRASTLSFPTLSNIFSFLLYIYTQRTTKQCVGEEYRMNIYDGLMLKLKLNCLWFYSSFASLE